MGTRHLLGCKFTGQASCISYGYRWDFGYPHPQAERCGQSSCEFLARLQEFACTGFPHQLSAQASWLCQVCGVTAQWQQENLHLHFVCVCVCACVRISFLEATLKICCRIYKHFQEIPFTLDLCVISISLVSS